MLLPLGGDEGGHRYRPIASSTQRATERLSTSRCIRSSVTSLRSRTSSARSSSLNAALPFSRLRRSPAHQLPSVPSLMPSSRATCAIGLPVSNTSCTAPCLKSASNFRYCLLIAPPQSDVSTLRGEAQGPPRGRQRNCMRIARPAVVAVLAVSGLSLAACGSSVKGTVSAAGQSTPSLAAPTSSAPVATTSAGPSLNARGNIVKALGVEGGWGDVDGQPTVTFVVDSITPDLPCDRAYAEKPENGHFVGIHMRMATAPGF